MKKIIIFVFILFIFGCKGEAKVTEVDGDFQIDFLFEKDGCKMYRFRDGDSRWVYWATCEGNTNYQYRSGGKHPTTHNIDSITTLR